MSEVISNWKQEDWDVAFSCVHSKNHEVFGTKGFASDVNQMVDVEHRLQSVLYTSKDIPWNHCEITKIWRPLHGELKNSFEQACVLYYITYTVSFRCAVTNSEFAELA